MPELPKWLSSITAYSANIQPRIIDTLCPMKVISDPETCRSLQQISREMTHHEEDLGAGFNLEWLSTRGWVVAPVERAQHFTAGDVAFIVAALNQAGYSECFAIATEPLDPFPEYYTVTISQAGFYAFNRECGVFWFLLTDETRTWAISCSEGYNLFAGPRHLVEAMIGKSIEDAWQEWRDLLNQLPDVLSDPRRKRSSRYEFFMHN